MEEELHGEDLGIALVGGPGAGGLRGAKVGESSGGGTATTCGTFNLAVNPWVGYEANAAVLAYVARRNLGCECQEGPQGRGSWQGFGTGEVDAVVENWGHDDLRKKYIDDQKTGVSAGSTGVKGQIGWYVPPCCPGPPGHPGLEQLNKYRGPAEDSESGGQGQLLDGDPSFRHQRRA